MPDTLSRTPPPKLYKYRSMSTECERDRVKDILLNNRLFFPTRSGFNDPFDCRIPVSFDVTREEVERKIVELFSPSIPTGGCVERFVKQVRKTGSVEKWLRSNAGKKVRELELDTVRVLCLCEQPDRILMWSHYANDHKGVCLEFNLLTGSYFEDAKSVNYLAQWPKLKITDGIKDLTSGVLLTKAEHWVYEKEWRVVCVKPSEFYAFPEKCLSGVILGCQITSGNESLITQWLTERGSPVTLYRAVKAPDKFAVTIEKIRDIGPPLM